MGWRRCLGLVAAGGNLLGGYFVVRREWPRKYLQYFLALGAGYMLAVALVEIIPESVKLGGAECVFVCAGRIFPDPSFRTYDCAAFSFWRRDA